MLQGWAKIVNNYETELSLRRKKFPYHGSGDVLS
jgi:hypothetical protein